MKMNEFAGELLNQIRKKKPLVHNITNFVVMNYTANALLACGASPVMAHAKEEVEEMTQIANALVLNIGTLEPEWVQAMYMATRSAEKRNIPVVMDPVGAGATRYRTETARELIQEGGISVIRGNASEILALANEKVRTRGVDSLHRTEDAALVASEIARTYRKVVAVTGATDVVSDGKITFSSSRIIVMIEHISIPLDERIVGLLRKHSKQEKRSISQVVELALEDFLHRNDTEKGRILSTKSAFQGSFSREEIY